ncbi:argininosuccinate synthase, partial [Gemmatimonas aurantiaca]|nr:argininosuccinate synthase [Gemmatimonas aurantiaca]
MSLVDIIQEVNAIAAKHGVGIIEHVEDRIVGIKVRDYYECPAAAVILPAHKDLERYVCTIHENAFKETIDKEWAYLVYAGLWYEPLLTNINAFINTMNQKVVGEVTVKVFKGKATVVARDSKNALYDKHHATFMSDDNFAQDDAVGFIKHWGLQTVLSNQIARKNSSKT